MRRFKNVLTADVNDKGVLDVDTVKGCTAGMNARPDGGCYNTCYAAKIAKYRGIDFTVAVTRDIVIRSQQNAIEQAVANSPQGFFRIGTMGDPCHAWEWTVRVVEWLSEFAVPVIITKHWMKLTDVQIGRLVAHGTVLNTSISALDTANELKHRIRQFNRFAEQGGQSVARIVSCDFNSDNPEGLRMARMQEELFKLRPTLDNPLRANKSHALVRDGVIRLTKIKDLASERTVSLANETAYVGHCEGCPDLCGLTMFDREEKPTIHQIQLL